MQHLFLILGGLVLTGGIGYFVGYDHGFDRAARAPEAGAFEATNVSDAAAVMGRIVGTWRSSEDPKFIREIRNDGVAVDRYEGEPESEGLWMVFTKEIPDTTFNGTFEDGAVYLSIAMGEDEKYYYKVLDTDAGSLVLIYLDRGNVLTFARTD
jgi:hypothetical protein